MNKLNNPYLTFPVEKPLLCIAFTVIITLIIGIGSYWIKIDDDFVKMFPKNIKSKIIWDEIQSEFGSSEKLVIAFGNKKQSITNYNDAFVDDEEAYAKLKHLIIELNELSDLANLRQDNYLKKSYFSLQSLHPHPFQFAILTNLLIH